MKDLLKTATCISMVLICGCSKYWYQEGKTFGECKQDQAACFAELNKRSDFGGMTMDYEFKFMDDCMCAKGYQEVSESELPLDARRQEPDSTLHWRARGVAGSLTEE